MLTALLASALTVQVADVLPDVTLVPGYMAQAYVTTFNPELPTGTPALRFSTGSLNIGSGRLELRGGEVVGDKQRVYQRVYRTDNSFYDREAGWFVYHPQHQHIHFENWTQFVLRKMNKDGGIGEAVATGAKTSFCILEILEWDPTLPGHNDPPGYDQCAQIQGLRPGWSDIYGSGLDGQYIDLTGVSDGDYWLEGIIDPNNQVLESNDGNNHVFVPVSIGSPPNAVPDPYESNNSMAEVDAMTPGALNSSNFGIVSRKIEIRNLSMDDPQDWFKFRTTKIGGAGDYVKMESPWTRVGNLNLLLYDSNGTLIKQSADAYNFEQISLKGLAAGTYYITVVRSGTTNNPRYWLTLETYGGAPPIANVGAPTTNGHLSGSVENANFVRLAFQTIPIEWTYPSTKSLPASITLFRSRTKNEGDAVSIDGYEDIPGHVHKANILTNLFQPGDWYIMARFVKDGATYDAWLPKKYTVYMKGDTNFDGKATIEEAQDLYHNYLKVGRPIPPMWKTVCDMDEDGDVDLKDYQLMYRAAEHGH